jgi:glycosyltransferase involved in cell wall biosynthesis
LADRTLLIALFSAGMLDEGDFHYRNYAPGFALSLREGVHTIGLSPSHPLRERIMATADVVVLHMVYDQGFLPALRERNRLGKPSVYEISDDLDAPTGWAPFDANIEKLRGKMKNLATQCDALQFPSEPLGQKFGRLAPRFEVFPNQMLVIPPERTPRRKERVVVGWGGSLTHLDDIAHLAPPLVRWVLSRNDAVLHLMAADPLWRLFDPLPSERKRLFPTGSIFDYYQFLDGIDIGLGPLCPTAFNLARTDIKYLEYAARGAVAAMQAVGPYRDAVKHGENGFLYAGTEDLGAVLDTAADDFRLRVRAALAARRYVVEERSQLTHARERLDFYRALLGERGKAPASDASPLFEEFARSPGALVNGRHLLLMPPPKSAAPAAKPLRNPPLPAADENPGETA